MGDNLHDFAGSGSGSGSGMLRNGGVSLGGSGSGNGNGGFGDGSQAGSELDFGTPQGGSMSIDTMMAENAGANNMYALGGGSGGAGGGGSLQSFGSDFGSNVLGAGNGIQDDQQQHRGSFSSFQGDQSPVMGQTHRLSVGGATSPTGNENINSFGQGEDFNSGGNDASGGNGGGAAPPPSWSELKTKAGKERKRLPLACIACRRKKIRCSGEKPACKHCLRSRIPCVYKVTTRKAAPRTDYMAMLDKRLKRMEDRIIKIIPKEEQSVAGNVARASLKPALPPAPPKSNSDSRKRGAEAAFPDELDEWASGSAGVIEQQQQQQLQQRQRQQQQQRQQQFSSKDTDVPTKLHEIEEQNLLVEGSDKLPSKAVQEHLSEVFFDYVYGQGYHLLHKPSFMRKLAQGTVPPVLMLAVCAISARFSNHPAVRTEPAFLRGEEWASVAREISLRRYDTPNITILIVYLILGLHEFGTCQGGRSWMFGGMAQRMAYALQLHKDLDHDPKYRREGDDEKSEMTFTDREIRRRTMWSCFLMDRFNSSGTDRPIFIGEQYIRAQLPIKERYYQMEISAPTEDLEGNVPGPMGVESGQMQSARDNMGVAAYQIRLIAIWGKLVNYLNLGGKDRDPHPMWAKESILQQLRRSVAEFKETLPDSLQYTPENLQNHATEKIANQFLFLHISYQQVILFMNRFALPIPGSRMTIPKGMPQSFLSEAVHAAHDAANQISTLIHEAMDHHVVAPFAGYCAFFSSTVHIYGAFSGKASLETSSKQNLAHNIKYLTKMKKHWGMFHFVTENLRDLYRRHADAARSGSHSQHHHPHGGKDGDSSIFQYGDWFDRYPHGVSGTDYEEPNTGVKKEPGADAVLGQKSDLQTVEEFFSKLSTPSRGAQMQVQGQAQGQQRKTQRTKRSKSESKTSAAEASAARQEVSKAQGKQKQNAQQQQQQQQQQPQQHQMLSQQGGGPSDQQPNTLDTQPTFTAGGNMPGFLPQQHQQAGFPPSTYQNPLLINPHHFVTHLDRQMVLDSYLGANPPASASLLIDPSAAPSSTSHPHQQQRLPPHQQFDPNQSPIDPTSSSSGAGSQVYPFGPFGAHQAFNDGTSPVNTTAPNAFWSDPSTAFFMPFNMVPPSIPSLGGGGGPGGSGTSAGGLGADDGGFFAGDGIGGGGTVFDWPDFVGDAGHGVFGDFGVAGGGGPGDGDGDGGTGG